MFVAIKWMKPNCVENIMKADRTKQEALNHENCYCRHHRRG